MEHSVITAVHLGVDEVAAGVSQLHHTFGAANS